MRSIRPFLFHVARLTSAAALVACTTSTDPTPIFSIRLQPKLDSVELGQTFDRWTVDVQDAAGVTLPGRVLTWESSAPGILTVDPRSGVVTPVGPIGEALIIVRAEGKQDFATIKVLPPILSIVATPDSFDLPLTTSRLIAVQLVGPGGLAITNRAVQWSSSSPNIAVVSANGLVTAVTTGTTTITIKAGTKQATVRVRVVGEPVTSVRITPQQTVHVVRLGQTYQLGAACLNASQQVLTGRTISWNTSNPLVATVSATGLVSGASVGSASITATCDGSVSATVTAQVTLVPVTSVTISPPNGLSMAVGTQSQLSFTARDSANNVLSSQGRTITWFSNNIPVAQVSPQGVVSGTSIGAAQITVTVDNGAGGSPSVTSAPVTVDVHAFLSMLNPSTVTPAPTRFDSGIRRATAAAQDR